MKIWKLSSVALIAMTLIVFFACKKSVSDPSLTSAAKGGPGGGPSGDPVFDLALPDADVMCETSTSYCFNTTLLNHGGGTPGGKTTISAKIVDPANGNALLFSSDVLNGSSGSVCFNNLALLAGTYTVIVHYDHVPNENAQPQHGDFEFPLTVQATADCGTTTCQTTGLTFSRTPVVVLNQSMAPIGVDVTYTVTNCTSDQTFTNLKIQGGLVNKAGTPTLAQGGTGLISSYSWKKNGGNYIITGYFDLAPGQYSTFNVKYSVGTSCNNYLTGEWSVKNGPVPVIDPLLLGTTSPYYVNRLYSVCP
jgi:hypothetical protein